MKRRSTQLAVVSIAALTTLTLGRAAPAASASAHRSPADLGNTAGAQGRNGLFRAVGDLWPWV